MGSFISSSRPTPRYKSLRVLTLRMQQALANQYTLELQIQFDRFMFVYLFTFYEQVDN